MPRRQGNGDYLGGNSYSSAIATAIATYEPIQAKAVTPEPRSAEDQAAFDEFEKLQRAPKQTLIKAGSLKGNRNA